MIAVAAGSLWGLGSHARLPAEMNRVALEPILPIEPFDGPQAWAEEEPALEIALPQVFKQPRLFAIRRGQLKNVEWLVARLYRAQLEQPGPASMSRGPLGQEYQALVNEFQPLLAWAAASWDYLLTTEGCRFIRRSEHEKTYCRGDYRAVTDKDYSRLLHRLFRHSVMQFAKHSGSHTLAAYLRTHFWDTVVAAYRKLENPVDPRQRKLTPYSYLRCIPYRFLNRTHEELVHVAVSGLARNERRALGAYFLDFCTLEAVAESMQLSAPAGRELVRRGLLSLYFEHRLVYCLLRQIERY